MSDVIIRPGVNSINRNLLLNTELQKLNDESIQQILNQYKYYEEKKEFKESTGKDVDLVISHKPTIPDLVIYNKTFNKNNCFLEANTNEKNQFPRKQFFIRFNEENREKFKKYSNSNKRKKGNEKKEENSNKKKEIEIKSGQVKIQEIPKNNNSDDDDQYNEEETKNSDLNKVNEKEEKEEKEEKS